MLKMTYLNLKKLKDLFPNNNYKTPKHLIVVKSVQFGNQTNHTDKHFNQCILMKFILNFEKEFPASYPISLKPL